MSLSRCVDLAKIRDFLCMKEEIIFFTEKDNLLHMFIYFPDKGSGYNASFSSNVLKEKARQFNFPNIQLLLSWSRTQLSNAQFAVESSDSGDITFTIGLDPSVQLPFLLSPSQSNADFIVFLSRALLSKQVHITELDNANEKSLDQLKCVFDSLDTPSLFFVFVFIFRGWRVLLISSHFSLQIFLLNFTNHMLLFNYPFCHIRFGTPRLVHAFAPSFLILMGVYMRIKSCLSICPQSPSVLHFISTQTKNFWHELHQSTA